ncbi:MAG: hypothetical protein JOZ99_15350 [Actinobacteria bacterium]|nr:hypothetical protein [Actinomycetota bacterium]
MNAHTLEVEWDKLRPGVTVVRPDGRHGRAAVVDRSTGGVVVLFTDGRRERHQPSERVRVLVREV